MQHVARPNWTRCLQHADESPHQSVTQGLHSVAR